MVPDGTARSDRQKVEDRLKCEEHGEALIKRSFIVLGACCVLEAMGETLAWSKALQSTRLAMKLATSEQPG